MFALGCILFEVTTGQKLFPDDWNIREYALKGEPIFPTLWPNCVRGSHLYTLGELAQALLDVDPFKRPSAAETRAALEVIRQGSVPELGNMRGSEGPVTQDRSLSPARNITVAPRYQAAPKKRGVKAAHLSSYWKVNEMEIFPNVMIEALIRAKTPELIKYVQCLEVTGVKLDWTVV